MSKYKEGKIPPGLTASAGNNSKRTDPALPTELPDQPPGVGEKGGDRTRDTGINSAK